MRVELTKKEKSKANSLLANKLEKKLKNLSNIEEVKVVIEQIEEEPRVQIEDLFDEIGTNNDRWNESNLINPHMNYLDNNKVKSNQEAISHGQPLKMKLNDVSTLKQTLKKASDNSPNKGIIYLADNNKEQLQTYPQLLQDAERILTGLKKMGLEEGDFVLFQFEKNENFIPTFWACILGGFVPTPLAVPSTFEDSNANFSKLINTYLLLNNPAVITDENLLAGLKASLKNLKYEEINISSTEKLRVNNRSSWEEGNPDSIVLNLLTSGSTGTPKCVQHVNGSVIARTISTIQFNGFTEKDVSLNWMPLDHVGGLVMYHILSVYLGCQQIVGKIDSFVSDPLNWLNWIEKYKVTTTWAPNFAFALVNEQEASIEKRTWDLTSVKHILNGGEVIIPKTAKRFLKLLAKHGLSNNCMYPSFGMSETSSGIVFSKKFNGNSLKEGTHFLDKNSLKDSVIHVDSNNEGAVCFTQLGLPIPGTSIRIVNSENKLVVEDTIGKVQVSGQTIMKGYYQNVEANKEVFTDDGWFETGDLGFLHRGGLTIVGREKEVIIINGNNYYNNEIETLVEEIYGVEITNVAACPIRLPNTEHGDHLAIFFSPTNNNLNFCVHVIKKIRSYITERLGVTPEYIIPIEVRDFPKTNSGKVKRSELAQKLMDGDFKELIERIDSKLGNHRTLPSWTFKRKWVYKDQLDNSRSLDGNYLLFVDGSNLSHEMECFLNNNSKGDVFTVYSGEKFKGISKNSYEINVSKIEDYDLLFKVFSQNNVHFDHIIHLWSYSLPEEIKIDPDNFNKYLSSFGVLFLTNACQKLNIKPISFSVISSKSQFIQDTDVINSNSLTIPGIITTLSKEWEDVRCKQIDVSPHYNDCEKILQEILTTDMSETLISYRNDKRYILGIEKVQLANKMDYDIPFVRGGFYLITGGLGGIGKHIAKYLLQSYGANILIIGRTKLNSKEYSIGEINEGEQEKLNVLNELKEISRKHGKVIYKDCSLSDLSTLESLINEYEIKLNQPLKGVIHLAGIFNRNYLVDLTEKKLNEMYDAKVFGSLNLYKVLSSRPNSLLILNSSSGTLSSDIMLGSYNSVNYFVESLSLYLNKCSMVKTYCFSWSLWNDIGLGKESSSIKNVLRDRGFQFINSKQGLYTMLAILKTNEPLIYVGLDEEKVEIERINYSKKKNNYLFRVYIDVKDKSFSLNNYSKYILDYLNNEEGIDFYILPFREYKELEHILGRRKISPQNNIEENLKDIWEELLDVTNISIEESFFSLGGNSIKVMKLISLIKKTFNVDLSFQSIFRGPTIREVSNLINVYSRKCTNIKDDHVTSHQDTKILPMSYAQRSQWFLHKLEPENPNYNNTILFDLVGPLRLDILKESIQKIISRHEPLRTRYFINKEQPSQIIDLNKPIDIPLVDLSNYSDAKLDNAITKIVQEEANLPFDLTEGPIIRVRVLRINDNFHTILLSIHHIASDGWSIGVFLKELEVIYEDILYDKSSKLSDVKYSYSDYAQEQNKWLDTDQANEKLNYWMTKLKEPFEVVSLPLDFRRENNQLNHLKYQEIFIEEGLNNKLRELCRKHNCTLYMLLLAGFSGLIYRYTNHTDMVLGTTLANRNSVYTDKLIGFFSNTLPLRINLNSNMEFKDLIQHIKKLTLEAFDNQEVPLEVIVKNLQRERKSNQNSIFQIVFLLQNFPMEFIKMNQIEMKNLNIISNTGTKFDIVLHVFESLNGLRIRLEYNAGLFKESTIKAFLNYYKLLLEGCVEN